MNKTRIAETEPPDGNKPYQAYALEEETIRSAYHYQQNPEFFMTLIGGEWHVYSCWMWEEDFTITQAQEKKLDKLAKLMDLKKGMHILDVGFGWGGPLVYLCKKYGVRGHGITISPIQIPVARQRAAKYGVDATFEVVHWQNLPEVETYDAIFSDEVMVHFYDLGGFFAKCHRVLKPDGVMVHKELHWTHSSHADFTPRLIQHINKVYGYTGNYRTLHEELKLLDDKNFELKEIFEIPLEHYRKTMGIWLENLFENRQHLKAITSPQIYKDFRLYIKGYIHGFRLERVGLYIVTSRKIVCA